MLEIKSQVASNEYRDNWDRIFKPKVMVREALELCGIPVRLDDSIPKDQLWLMRENRIDKIVRIGAPENG